MRKIISSVCLFLMACNLQAADSLSLPQDPRQSISYWKEHTISAQQDDRVALAERVFKKLLRAWDSARVEPGLYVVNTSNSAWAASLADGNILLSREAIDISLSPGLDQGEHLLAFVLAHELAHQRSDDLWHQRFFRSVRLQDEKDHARLLDGLPLDAELVRDIEQKEIQADRDGLVLMASVGFDPWQVLQQKDFFTRWVENIWKLACDQKSSQKFVDACQQAQTRALRARVQLDTVVGQSAIYELGIQALVAKQYPAARRYFTLYGREFPGRAIMSAIGISYLAEAMESRQQINRLAGDGVGFYFPLLLDARLNLAQVSDQAKRSVTDPKITALKEKLKTQVELAVRYLEKAIRLDPDYRPLYLSIAIAHLIENNQYLVRGILQGRYLPRFGQDAVVEMMLALSQALEGEFQAAAKELSRLIEKPGLTFQKNTLSPDLFYYTAAFNLAEIYRQLDQQDSARAVWQKLALQSQSQGRAFLFRLALAQIGAGDQPQNQLVIAPTIKGVRLGDRKPRDDSPHRINELWIEGELFHVYVYQDGARYISAADGKIISASQVGGTRTIGDLVKVGESADRPLKTLGIPDRQLQLTTGEYIAYDRYGLALKLDDNRIQGWFLYP